MCGFIGVYNKHHSPIQLETVEKMTQSIIHRGPDEEGIYMDHHVAFGFRRLSIIDLENGSQPFFNEDKTIWIIFNGEIYNYQELRQWLQSIGKTLQTHSDTETILRLYEELGMDCIHHLRGMFSFIIWDTEKKMLFGARDHFGIKPLYWTETDEHIAFATEIKSLLELDGVKREIHPQSFYQYLTFQYVPDPYTMFRGIQKIPPGHRFIIRNGKFVIEPYWEVKFDPKPDKPLSYFVEKTRAALEDSIQHHRISDVPRGAFLSSGVDSSTVVGLLKQHENVKTFTVGFDIPGYNELECAQRIARYFGTDHHEIKVDSRSFLESLPRLVWHQDEPVADPSAIPLYFVAQLARQHVTVVLSGEGADEFFGGYNIYREPFSLQIFSHLPEEIRKWIGEKALKLPHIKGRNYLIRGSKSLEERYFGNALIFDELTKKSILPDSLAQMDIHPWEITHPIFEKAKEYDDVTKMQYLDIHTWLRGNILMKADKMTMANSLELRVPFIDLKVFEAAAEIPTKYKIAKGTTKYVLREAMKDILPEEIHFRKKWGFPVPIRLWLKDEFFQWAKELICESSVDEWINKDFALTLLSDHKDGKGDYSRKIWTILIFILWHQIYIEKKYRFESTDLPHVKKHRYLFV